jgi:hypothetical protein
VSIYLSEFGPIVAWNEAWFIDAFEDDSNDFGLDVGMAWIDYQDAAKAALGRSQRVDLKHDPREDESQWRTVEAES